MIGSLSVSILAVSTVLLKFSKCESIYAEVAATIATIAVVLTLVGNNTIG